MLHRQYIRQQSTMRAHPTRHNSPRRVLRKLRTRQEMNTDEGHSLEMRRPRRSPLTGLTSGCRPRLPPLSLETTDPPRAGDCKATPPVCQPTARFPSIPAVDRKRRFCVACFSIRRKTMSRTGTDRPRSPPALPPSRKILAPLKRVLSPGRKKRRASSEIISCTTRLGTFFTRERGSLHVTNLDISLHLNLSHMRGCQRSQALSCEEHCLPSLLRIGSLPFPFPQSIATIRDGNPR